MKIGLDAWLRRNRGSLDISISKNDYKKHVSFAAGNRGDILTRDDSSLWNFSGSANLTSRLSLYGGISRGMEDAPIAPENAINNSEAPPAIRGVKLVLRPQIANLFNTYGWLVSGNGGFTFIRKRTAFMSVVADF